MTTIIDFFTRIYEFVLSLFSACFEWLTNLFSGWIENLLSSIESVIPDLSSYWSNFSAVQPYLSFVNKWVALDVAFTLFSAYLVFIFTMITVKLIVKLFIPTVG